MRPVVSTILLAHKVYVYACMCMWVQLFGVEMCHWMLLLKRRCIKQCCTGWECRPASPSFSLSIAQNILMINCASTPGDIREKSLEKWVKKQKGKKAKRCVWVKKQSVHCSSCEIIQHKSNLIANCSSQYKCNLSNEDWLI